MTEALASRVAGLKLGGIVAVLLLPMLVLSYFMIAGLRQEIEFAEREMAGIELNRQIMPVALAAANRTLETKDVNNLSQNAASLAETLGVQTQFSNALASLVTYSDDPRHAVDALTTLLHDSATASNIILDSYAETITSARFPHSMVRRCSRTSCTSGRCSATPCWMAPFLRVKWSACCWRQAHGRSRRNGWRRD